MAHIWGNAMRETMRQELGFLKEADELMALVRKAIGAAEYERTLPKIPVQ